MAYYRTAMSGGGSGIVNTVKLLTDSQALTSTGVTYTFPSNYKFARVRIVRNNVATQGQPNIRISCSVDTTNLSNDQNYFTMTVNKSVSAVFFDITNGATITIKRVSSGTTGEGARYSEFDIDMYN